MAAEEPKVIQVAKLSVDVINMFKEKYPEEILQAFVFAGKYMTIAAMDHVERERIDLVSNPKYCPLCHVNMEDDRCVCPIVRDTGMYCLDAYVTAKDAIKVGTYIETAFHIGPLVKKILGWRKDK